MERSGTGERGAVAALALAMLLASLGTSIANIALPAIAPDFGAGFGQVRWVVIAYLAAAGVGTIGVVDDDTVALSNLQRQVLHDEASLGRPKVASAEARLKAINPHVRVQPYEMRLDAENAAAVFADFDLILDGTARADSIPGLEIEADDVRCTHVATISKIEPEYLFYLMARGLSKFQAEQMIVTGFFEEVLNRVPVEGVRRKLEQVIARKIHM